MTQHTFSPGQQRALDAIGEWFDDCSSQTFYLAGPAGTGKTTIARQVPRHLGLSGDQVRYAAYTGKAAQVLRSKGCAPASTLHSLIYIRQSTAAEAKLNTVERQLRALRLSLDATPFEIAELEAQRQQLLAEVADGSWILNTESDLSEASLLICDEVSMVDDKLAADLLSFGVPILVLGDPEQLPPINGEGFFTRRAPDLTLTEIHRQALDSPILSLATRVRQGGRLGHFDYAYADVEMLSSHDQVLCGKRATRWSLVYAIRSLLGRPHAFPVAGDRVMCLRNNRELGIFNGQLFDVLDCGPSPKRIGYYVLTVRTDDGEVFDVVTPVDGFISDEAERDICRVRHLPDGVAIMTFAQAITVHKSQGSEWGRVALIDESAVFAREADTPRRWLYTGITRASAELTIASGWYR